MWRRCRPYFATPLRVSPPITETGDGNNDGFYVGVYVCWFLRRVRGRRVRFACNANPSLCQMLGILARTRVVLC